MGVEALIHLVVWFVIFGCIIAGLLYLINVSPIPDPFKGWIWFIVVAVAILIVIYYVLLPMLGAPPQLRMGR